MKDGWYMITNRKGNKNKHRHIFKDQKRKINKHHQNNNRTPDG